MFRQIYTSVSNILKFIFKNQEKNQENNKDENKDSGHLELENDFSPIELNNDLETLLNKLIKLNEKKIQTKYKIKIEQNKKEY